MYSDHFLKYQEKIQQLKNREEFSSTNFEISFLSDSEPSKLRALSEHTVELVFIDDDTFIIRLRSVDIDDYKEIEKLLNVEDLKIQLDFADKQSNIFERIMIDDAIFVDILPTSISYLGSRDSILKFVAK